jgi:hypothetical protein
MAGRDSSAALFVVLTVDPSRYRDAQAAFEAVSSNTRGFVRRLRRKFGDVEWCQTVEVHRSNWPHVNMILYCAELAELVRELGERVVNDNVLRDVLLASGFGYVAHLSAPRSEEALAGYITKVAHKFGAVAGEVAKLSQLPITAPTNYHRLRTSKGFLPAAEKNANVTGWIVNNATGMPLRPLTPQQQAILDRNWRRDEHDQEQVHVQPWMGRRLAVDSLAVLVSGRVSARGSP